MHADGNLALYGESLEAEGAFELAWQSNSTLFNYSGESVPRLELDDDGILVVHEYHYRGVQSIAPIPIWSAADSQTSTEEDQDAEFDVVLVLSNGCCLELAMLDAFDSALWGVCAVVANPSPEPTVDPIAASSTDADIGGVSDESTSSQSTFTDSWWVWLLLVVLVLLAMVVSIVCRRSLCVDDGEWVSPVDPDDVRRTPQPDSSTDEAQHEFDLQLTQWIQETETETQHGERKQHDQVFEDINAAEFMSADRAMPMQDATI